ncbi:MAG TPA: hypothetical protein PK360_12130, partial [bacterium]|nr:hypothetical protein [bacterium]
MKKFTLTCLLLILGISLVVNCGRNTGPASSGGATAQGGNPGGNAEAWGKPEKLKFKIPVTVQQVQRGRMYAYLQAVGTVVPIKEIEIKPEMTGRI